MSEFIRWNVFVFSISLSVAPRGPAISYGASPCLEAFIKAKSFNGDDGEGLQDPICPQAVCTVGIGLARRHSVSSTASLHPDIFPGVIGAQEVQGARAVIWSPLRIAEDPTVPPRHGSISRGDEPPRREIFAIRKGDVSQKEIALISRATRASPTAKNKEILESLSMLWRQRHLEQRQEEAQQQCRDTPGSSPLFNAGDEGYLTRKSGTAFRARAYKTAYEILGSSRIPIHNIAEVLLLLREGGLVLRGEEKNIVKRGAFRSAVLQKILVVLSHGVAELIRKSRNAMREGAIHDLSRLPGVSRRTAGVLFDDCLIDNAQALRDDLAALAPGASLPSAAASHRAAQSKQWAEPSETLDQQDKTSRLLKLFPTALSRACIVHADSFGAPMNAAEFDEWQQQLLLVQQSLREMPTLSPPLALGLPELEEGRSLAASSPEGLRALPVVSLGGGIFHGGNRKLTSLSLQVSLLPNWTEEEGLLPPTLERAVCNGGEGAGPGELRWVQEQWERVSQAFGRLRMQLHRSVVEALQQRHLVSEVFCENSRTKTTHAAGRLPWHQETYRLQKAQQQWGCNLTPSGFAPSGAKPPAQASSHPDAPEPPSSPGTDADSREGAQFQSQSNESCKAAPVSAHAVAEQAWWVLDEQGVLRLLQEPLSMQERVGDVGDTT
ncbi:hypothetical protein, conserved [Eimeria praecox]|uniref:Uncharacterized protein n=1 Tax=Eimeria praecox TaxID=51316 RepID=U6G3W0_9EIME|nr:hypothetical protein, conserved [Eimeria praecox]